MVTYRGNYIGHADIRATDIDFQEKLNVGLIPSACVSNLNVYMIIKYKHKWCVYLNIIIPNKIGMYY